MPGIFIKDSINILHMSQNRQTTEISRTHTKRQNCLIIFRLYGEYLWPVMVQATVHSPTNLKADKSKIQYNTITYGEIVKTNII